MIGIVITLAAASWILYSLFRPSASDLLQKAKPSYTPQEFADLAYQIKRDAGFLYLVYGIGLGAVTVGLLKG